MQKTPNQRTFCTKGSTEIQFSATFLEKIETGKIKNIAQENRI